jgi:hypothetical protein
LKEENEVISSSSSSSCAGVNTSGEISMSLEPLIAESNLVCMTDRDLVPDCLFVAMAQMKPCKLTRIDRVGCYKSRDIGFIGMACKHCGGQPGFGRYFPNSVRSLAQTTTSQTILKHVSGKCSFVPPHVRDAILELQRLQVIREGFPAGRPRYGSRKVFFQRIWHRLHGDEIQQALEQDEVSAALTSTQPKTTFGIPTAPPTNHNNLAIPSDTSSTDASESASSSSSSQTDEEIVCVTTTTPAAAVAAATPVTNVTAPPSSLSSNQQKNSNKKKRTMEYASPEYYFPKRPKTSSSSSSTTTTTGPLPPPTTTIANTTQWYPHYVAYAATPHYFS